MLRLVPELHQLVGSSASRNLSYLRTLGAGDVPRGVEIAVVAGRKRSRSQGLLARELVDMLLRLDPLVAAVIVDLPGEEEELVRDLSLRLPMRVETPSGGTAYSVGVGLGSTADLLVDADGWVVALGELLGSGDETLNPVGPLTAATLACGESFKWAFHEVFPEVALATEPWRGRFSFATFDDRDENPAIRDVVIDTTLVGTGGVSAGLIRAVAALGSSVSGVLRLVDHDILTVDNLNRVSYATLAAALSGRSKVMEAKAFLEEHCPRLQVVEFAETFSQYKRRLGPRAERRYDVVVTGLDNDDVRREVQRDLPRILIDGSTGKDTVARIERIEFGQYGCLGCSRPNLPERDDDVACDDPPDPHAPSLSFVSAFAGTLAAGELIKESAGITPLRGRFDLVFRYGPNPAQRTTPGIRADCAVACSNPSKLEEYRRKYRAQNV